MDDGGANNAAQLGDMLSFHAHAHYGLNTTLFQALAALRGGFGERDVYDILKDTLPNARENREFMRNMEKFELVLKFHRLFHSANVDFEFCFESFRELVAEFMKICEKMIPVWRSGTMHSDPGGDGDGEPWWSGYPFFFEEEPTTLQDFGQVFCDVRPAQLHNFIEGLNSENGIFLPTKLWQKAQAVPPPLKEELLPGTTDTTEATPLAFLNLIWKFIQTEKFAEEAGKSRGRGEVAELVVEAGKFYFDVQKTISGFSHVEITTGLFKLGFEVKGLDVLNMLPSLADLENAAIRENPALNINWDAVPTIPPSRGPPMKGAEGYDDVMGLFHAVIASCSGYIPLRAGLALSATATAKLAANGDMPDRGMRGMLPAEDGHRPSLWGDIFPEELRANWVANYPSAAEVEAFASPLPYFAFFRFLVATMDRPEQIGAGATAVNGQKFPNRARPFDAKVFSFLVEAAVLFWKIASGVDTPDTLDTVAAMAGRMKDAGDVPHELRSW